MTKPWFHGRISGKTASERLKSASLALRKDGMFLVRQNTQCKDILVVTCSGRVRSFEIHASAARGGYRIGDGPLFMTMQDLVLAHMQHKRGLPCALKSACPRSRDKIKVRL